MKIVMAIIKPFKLEEVRDALTAIGVHGLTVTDQVDKTIDAITSAAKTGQIGDGKIFVINLDHAVRIRTGEADAAAL
jgi:nitrogen regulatory protein P-II 2